jgi:hypothetical protein
VQAGTPPSYAAFSVTWQQHEPNAIALSRVVRRGNDGMYFFGGGGGIEPVRTLVPIVVNRSKDPKVIDADALCEITGSAPLSA